MLYTGKGDSGTTKTLTTEGRIDKSAPITEALGTVDEVNALLGKLKQSGSGVRAVEGVTYEAMLSDIQQDLFIAQAELAGAPMALTETHVAKLSAWVNAIEQELPPITSFFVSGGTILAAECDIARTVARRAERRVIAAFPDPALRTPHAGLLAYLNRLSSVLYALARLANHRAGITEERPHY